MIIVVIIGMEVIGVIMVGGNNIMNGEVIVGIYMDCCYCCVIIRKFFMIIMVVMVQVNIIVK